MLNVGFIFYVVVGLLHAGGPANSPRAHRSLRWWVARSHFWSGIGIDDFGDHQVFETPSDDHAGTSQGGHGDSGEMPRTTTSAS